MATFLHTSSASSAHTTHVPYIPLANRNACRRVSISNRYGNQRRPLTRPSLPVSPTQKKKSVRFCDDQDLEQVRLFLKTQTPLAVHSDPPLSFQEETRYEIKYPGWPSKLMMYKSLANAAIRMENIQLDHDVLIGRCRVANLAYQKQVTVRYSLDFWQTHHEIDAIFREPIASTTNTWDRFTFEIPLDDHHHADMDDETSPNATSAPRKPITCWVALRYQVNGQDFWDNNDGKNYQIDLLPVIPSTPPLQLSDNEDDEEDEAIDPPPSLQHPIDKPSPSTHRIEQPTTAANTHPLNQQPLKWRYSFANARYDLPPQQDIAAALVPKPRTVVAAAPTTTTTTTPAMATAATTNPTASSHLHIGYDDFITKYCFYNSSSLIQG
ncbi:putative phosphatase regulatory subunit-domain-containing protein [Gongronella butleri]|nr:putative phosphatase regulatory subunit-domain-containing protein [Gongronella butleri]